MRQQDRSVIRRRRAPAHSSGLAGQSRKTMARSDAERGPSCHHPTDGTSTFDTPLMASRYGWTAEVIQDYARQGLVRRKVEQGVEKDQGC